MTAENASLRKGMRVRLTRTGYDYIGKWPRRGKLPWTGAMWRQPRQGGHVVCVLLDGLAPASAHYFHRDFWEEDK